MMRKVKYTLPKAQSGMEVQNSGSGLNGHTMPWPTRDNPFSVPDIQVNKTLQPVRREDATLEAESGETAFTDMTGDGIPQLYKIGGNPHSSGGTPLNLPEDSFIFSKDKKMKIGGDILNSFGKPKGTKDKYTPAELSNQYQINDFRKVLADPDTDKLQRDTAEKMIANYNLKLAKLGLVQESSKGFPDGIPAIAMPYIDMMGIDPSQFVTPQEQGQPQGMPTARYGGLPLAQDGKTYRSEREYKEHLRDPYSKEKAAAQMAWNMKQAKRNAEVKEEEVSSDDTELPGYLKYPLEVLNAIGKGSNYLEQYPAYLATGMDPLYKPKYEEHSETIDRMRTLKNDPYRDYRDPAKFDQRNFPDVEQSKMSPGAAVLTDIALDPSVILGYEALGKLAGKGAKATAAGSKNLMQFAKTYGPAIPDMIGLYGAKLYDIVAKYGDKAYDILKSAKVSEVAGRVLPTLSKIPNDSNQPSYEVYNPSETVHQMTPPQYGAPITTPVDVKTKPVSNLQINTPIQVPETNIDSIAKAQGYAYGGELIKAQTGAVVENKPDGKGNLVLWVNGKNTGKTKPDPNFKPSQKTPAKGTGTQSPNTNPPAAGDVDGKGAYVYTGKERTPEGLNPSSKWTTDELKAKYKEQGIDYENMTDKEAQAALYDKSDPYEKAYMWGSIGNTKKGLSSGQGAKFDKYKPQKGESFPTYKARLATAGYTPDTLNKELEPFKESFADSYRGVREAWLLDPYKAPAAAAGKKEEVNAPPIEQAIIPDAYKTPKPKWWLQDQIKTAGAFNDLMRIKKYDPWQATPAVAYGERTFFDPTRELASNAEQVNMGIQGASTFSGPQSFAATAAYLQGQGSKNAADIMGRYNNLNVNASNQLSDMNTGIFNQAAQQRAASATQLFDKQTVANQNFDNSKNMARQNLRQGFIDAVTNRANTYNLNTLYPQYAIDPTTGGMAYNPTGSNRRPDKNPQATPTSMEDQITKIRKSSLSSVDQDLWIKSLFGKGQSDQQTG